MAVTTCAPLHGGRLSSPSLERSMGSKVARRHAALGAAVLLLLAACADRPARDIALTPGSNTGVVILSLLAPAGDTSESTYWYRSAEGGGTRAIELTARQPGQTPDAFPLLLAGGEIVVLQLQPGTYVIERLEVRRTINQRIQMQESRFAVAFQVVAGKVLYAGQLSLVRGILGTSASLGVTDERARRQRSATSSRCPSSRRRAR